MDRTPKPPEVAAMHRRAAALFLHYRSDTLSTEGITAILEEMPDVDGLPGFAGSDMAWMGLVMSLVMVGNEMSKAALRGHEDIYLQSVIQRSSIDETRTR